MNERPPKCYTYYFNRRGVAELAPLAGKPLPKLRGRRFAGIRPGDRIYVVHVHDGKLRLFCRLVVGSVDLQAGTIRAESSTPITLDRQADGSVLRALRFLIRSGNPVGLRFESNGALDRQTLRGVRELVPDSAALLDDLIEADWRQPELPFQNEKATDRHEVVEGLSWRALSVRQPWAELILRGAKSIEVRSRATRVRERVHLYASPVRLDPSLERSLAGKFGLDIEKLPRGVLVGSVEVVDCRPLNQADAKAACVSLRRGTKGYAWQLADPKRANRFLRPSRRPQPIWFYPFVDPPKPA